MRLLGPLHLPGKLKSRVARKNDRNVGGVAESIDQRDKRQMLLVKQGRSKRQSVRKPESQRTKGSQGKSADAGGVADHRENKRRRMVKTNQSPVVVAVVEEDQIREMDQTAHPVESHPEVKKTVKCNPQLQSVRNDLHRYPLFTQQLPDPYYIMIRTSENHRYAR